MAGRSKGTPIRLQPAPIFTSLESFKVEIVLGGTRLGFVELRMVDAERVDVITTSRYGTETVVASFTEDGNAV